MHNQCTWEPADESCPQYQARYSGPELLQQFEGVVLRGPVHAQQREVADVLQRDVNVLTHLQQRVHSTSQRGSTTHEATKTACFEHHARQHQLHVYRQSVMQ